MKEETSLKKKLLAVGMIIAVLSTTLIGVYFGFKDVVQTEKAREEQAQIEKVEEEVELETDESLIIENDMIEDKTDDDTDNEEGTEEESN